MDSNSIIQVAPFMRLRDLLALGGSCRYYRESVAGILRRLSNFTQLEHIAFEVFEGTRKFTVRELRDAAEKAFSHRNFMLGRVDNYIALRWALFDKDDTTGVGRAFRKAFRRPFPDSYTWRRRSMRALIQNLKTKSEFRQFFKERAARKSHKLAALYSSWNFCPIADRAAQLVVGNSCSMCFEHIAENRGGYACGLCDVAFRSVNENNENEVYFHNNCLVNICTTCADNFVVSNPSHVEWHCPLRNPYCVSYGHAGQGCTCPCHTGERKDIDYLLNDDELLDVADANHL